MNVNSHSLLEFTAEYGLSLLRDLLPDYKNAVKNDCDNKVEPQRVNLEILFESIHFDKELLFTFSQGDHISGQIYNYLGFTISTTSKFESIRTYFNIGDYYKFRRIDRNIESYFFSEDQKSDEDKVIAFVDELKFFIGKDEVSKLITSNDWIDVPQNRSDYF